MDFRQRVLASVVAWSALAVVGPCPRVDAQGPTGRIEGPVRERERALPKVERALRRVRRRVERDPALVPSPDGSIQRDDDFDGSRLSLWVRARDPVEIPTRVAGTSKPVPGHVGIIVDCSEKAPSNGSASGLHHGMVSWKTSDPRVFASLSWLCTDLGLPDRVLAIVRDELAREGIELRPMEKRRWPCATASERLSHLLPPDPGPAEVPPAGPPPAGRGPFASPRDVVAACNRAAASKDRRASLDCLTPFSQGALFRVLLDAPIEGRFVALAGAIEAGLKLDIFDATFDYVDSQEVRDFLDPPEAEMVGVDRAPQVRLLESVRRRVGDVPRFLADCLRQAPGLGFDDDDEDQGLDCDGFRVEGDRASGCSTSRPPAADADDVEQRNPTQYLPRYQPIRFRRIDGRWLIADEAEGAP